MHTVRIARAEISLTPVEDVMKIISRGSQLPDMQHPSSRDRIIPSAANVTAKADGASQLSMLTATADLTAIFLAGSSADRTTLNCG